MTQPIRVLTLLSIILAIPACAAQTFNYPPQARGYSIKDTSFYKPLPGEGTLANVTGTEIKNVILCIGDGMGSNHVALARHRALGSDKRLTMERLPVAGLMRTYSADNMITDSAASATAMASGIKTNNGRIGMDPDGTSYKTILEELRKKGWRTGLVATSAISHATPAGFASHVRNRDNQNDIAVQMLENRVDVMFGGGAKYWQARRDRRNLVSQAEQAGYQVAYTKEQMQALRNAPAIGLFAEDGLTTIPPEPMLDEMAQKAIEMISSGPEWFAPQPRFFMMIEGSQIDWAAHNNETENTIRQTLLFDMAVRRAVEFAQNDRHTLVIVTADHETGGLLIKTALLNSKKVSPDWNSKDHTGCDVPIYAFGPGSERFAGTLDNTELPKRIAELTGVSPFPAVLSPENVPVTATE